MRMAILHSRVTGSNVKQSRSSQKFSCARSLTALWQRKRAMKPSVPTARPYGDGNWTVRKTPSLQSRIPHADIVSRQSESDGLLFARKGLDVGETSKDGGRFSRRLRMIQVELRDLGIT